MVKAVKGFITKAGQFFEKKVDADLQDAIDDLEFELGSEPQGSDTLTRHFLYLLNRHLPVVKTYIEAKEAHINANPETAAAKRVSSSDKDNDDAERVEPTSV